MGLKDWSLQRDLETARSNLRSSLQKLVPIADAGWDNTERCLLAEIWPLPEEDPNVHVYQKQLLEDLTIRKGQLSDREAVEFIGAEIQSAGVGAKMAVRHVVITEWPKDAKPAITQAEMEQILGSRDDDTKRSELLRTYALHHLALEQAVAETTGKRPQTTGPVRPTSAAAPRGTGMAMWLLYAYMVMSVVMGIAAMFKEAVYPGIAGIVGPMLSWGAAAGLKGSLLVGRRSQTLGGLVAAIVFAAVGFGLVHHSGYWVRIFSFELTGVEWCVIGLVIGYIAAEREHSV